MGGWCREMEGEREEGENGAQRKSVVEVGPGPRLPPEAPSFP